LRQQSVGVDGDKCGIAGGIDIACRRGIQDIRTGKSERRPSATADIQRLGIKTPDEAA
jgi:hypothetical protein